MCQKINTNREKVMNAFKNEISGNKKQGVNSDTGMRAMCRYSLLAKKWQHKSVGNIPKS